MTEFDDEFDPDELADDDGEPEPTDELESGEPVGGGPAPALAPPPTFDYNHRLIALGFSRSGKSEFLNVIFSGLESQRLLIDNKPEFTLEHLDIAPVRRPGEVDWSQPIIHYQPLPGSDPDQYEELLGVVIQRRGITVCVHEFGAICDYNANKAGPNVKTWLAQGGSQGQGALVGAQRTVYFPVSGLTEANHVTVWTPGLARREDMQTAAEAMSPVGSAPLTGRELSDELSALKAEHGLYSFLWRNKLAEHDVLHAFPPIPQEVRNLNIVRRTEDA